LDSAAVLAFSTLFAIVPTLTLVFSVFSLSPYFADLQQLLEDFLFQQLLPQKADFKMFIIFVISNSLHNYQNNSER
jgi:uncharacterized BrkB/YihY/UPF0761 family membrane protein